MPLAPTKRPMSSLDEATDSGGSEATQSARSESTEGMDAGPPPRMAKRSVSFTAEDEMYSPSPWEGSPFSAAGGDSQRESPAPLWGSVDVKVGMLCCTSSNPSSAAESGKDQTTVAQGTTARLIRILISSPAFIRASLETGEWAEGCDATNWSR